MKCFVLLAFTCLAATLPTTAIDTDGDSIPNAWEIANSMNPDDPDDATGDFDRDGLTALQEYELSLEGKGQGVLGNWATEIHDLSNINTPGFAFNQKTIVKINDENDVLINVISYNLPYTPANTRYAAWVRNGSDGTWRKIATVGENAAQYLYAYDLNSNGQVVGVARHSSTNGGNTFGFSKNMRESVHNTNVLPWFTEDHPLTPVQSLTGINHWGDVIGTDSAGLPLFESELFGTITVPTGWISPVFTGLNDLGEVIGIEQSDPISGSGAYSHFLMMPGWSWLTPFPGYAKEIFDPQGEGVGEEGFQAYFRPSWINDWGEFGGRYGVEIHEENHAEGSWFFDGDYRELLPPTHRMQTIRGLNNWPQVLVTGSTDEWGEETDTFLLADDIRAPLSAFIENPLITTHGYDQSLPVGINNRSVIVGWTHYGNKLYLARPDQDHDGDEMPDDWESYFDFDPEDPSDVHKDSDGDGWSNLAEWRLRRDPRVAFDGPPPPGGGVREAIDEDGDGLPDSWERANFPGLDLVAIDPHDDPDGDSLTNHQEFLSGTSPTEEDTDGDGALDHFELLYNCSPSDPASTPDVPVFKVVVISRLDLPGGIVVFEDPVGEWLTAETVASSGTIQDKSYTWSQEPDGNLRSELKLRLMYPLDVPFKLPVLKWRTDEEVFQEATKLEFEIAAGDLDSNVIETNTPAGDEDWHEGLLPVEVAPEVLAVNSDFDEGRIDPATGYAIPDCDDMPGVDQKTGSGNTQIALNASRAHLDGLFANDEKVTDDMHKGWFGVNPKLMNDDFWSGANVTIRKIDKDDPDTGYKESGQVRFYAKWSGGYYGIAPYDFQTLQPVNLVSAGVNGNNSSVYGASSTIPDGAEFYMEGVRPGKITLEWRYQKGTIDVKYEQTFKVETRKTPAEWKTDLAYKIRLDTNNDPSGQIDVNVDPRGAAREYWVRVERMSEYYDYYQENYLVDDDFQWCGLARIAGSQVISGVSDARFATLSPSANTYRIVGEIIDSMSEGGYDIFDSLAWQHHAYRSSGLGALEWTNDNFQDQDLDQLFSIQRAWHDFDEGINGGGAALVEEAAYKKADYEQNIVIVATWNALGVITPVNNEVTNTFTILAENVMKPNGDRFTVAVPGGDLSDTADRWRWIDDTAAGSPNGIIGAWKAAGRVGQNALVSKTLRVDSERFTQVPAPLRATAGLFSGERSGMQVNDDLDTP